MFFFFNDPAPTEIYTLSLHDALPISLQHGHARQRQRRRDQPPRPGQGQRAVEKQVRGDHAARCEQRAAWSPRSEEHTSELQSRRDLVCRLLLEKKKKKKKRK